MQAYRALICDLDMTLIDSRKDIASAVLYAINNHRDKSIDYPDIYPWIGKGLQPMIKALIPAARPSEVDEIIAKYKEYFFDHCNVDTFIYKGVVDTLETLAQRGIQAAVASAKMTFMATRVCQVFGLDRLMNHIQGTDDFPGKPDPTVIVKACRALGIKAEQAVFVGDTIMDVQAAKRAGCCSVAVTYGIGSKDALMEEKPDHLIDHFPDILSVMQDS